MGAHRGDAQCLRAAFPIWLADVISVDATGADMFIFPFYTHAPRRVGVHSRHASVGAVAEAVAKAVAESEAAVGGDGGCAGRGRAAEAKAAEAAADPNSGSQHNF